jgi:hypothetical protein
MVSCLCQYLLSHRHFLFIVFVKMTVAEGKMWDVIQTRVNTAEQGSKQSVKRTMTVARGELAHVREICDSLIINDNKTPNVVGEWLTLLLRIRRSRVQTLARRPTILTEVFVVFISPSRKKNRERTLKLGHDRFLQILSYSHSLTALSFDAIWS